MAKKVTALFYATLTKNTEKGGAWIAEYSIRYEGTEAIIKNEHTAWANAGAGKRWVKAMTQTNTPRKSIKMIADDKVDEKGKPVLLKGELSYKVEA